MLFKFRLTARLMTSIRHLNILDYDYNKGFSTWYCHYTIQKGIIITHISDGVGQRIEYDGLMIWIDGEWQSDGPWKNDLPVFFKKLHKDLSEKRRKANDARKVESVTRFQVAAEKWNAAKRTKS